MDVQETVGKTKTFIRTSATLKIIAVGILVLVLQIPAAMISSVIHERESRRDKYFTLTVCALLLILYAYLYIVLQLEDYALIMGALGLFAVLTTVMYLTKKVDWYAAEVDSKPAEED